MLCLAAAVRFLLFLPYLSSSVSETAPLFPSAAVPFLLSGLHFLSPMPHSFPEGPDSALSEKEFHLLKAPSPVPTQPSLHLEAKGGFHTPPIISGLSVSHSVPPPLRWRSGAWHGPSPFPAFLFLPADVLFLSLFFLHRQGALLPSRHTAFLFPPGPLLSF